MTRALILAVALGACSHGAGARGAGPAAVASGTLIDSAGQRVGVATVVDTAGAVRLAISVGGLTPGAHGLHLHERGTCTPPDFASAGGHFNPDGRKHGRRNPEGPHAGDLANLIVEANGSADTSFALPAALVGTGPRSLIRPGGTALVIHARADDERSDPGGNAGERVACAVLEPG
jgi:superoxide dismutase, Cu-Zn family